MTFFELVLRLIGLAILGIIVVAIIAGVFVFKYNVLDPRQHTRNVEKALISNLETWETGIATIYTVIANIETENASHSSSVDVVCAPKTFTSNGFDGGVRMTRSARDFGTRDLSIPLSGSYRVTFDTDFSCTGLAKHQKEHGFPYAMTGYQPVKIQHGAAPTTSCASFVGQGPVQLRTMRVLPPQVVSVRQEPVSEAISVKVYNPDDSSSSTESQRRNALRDTFRVLSDHRFYWRQEEMCWASGTQSEEYICSQLANQYCEPNPQ